MKKYLASTLLALSLFALPSFAQQATELTCPAGYSLLPGQRTLDPATNQFRNYECVQNSNGHALWNDEVTNGGGGGASVIKSGLLAEYRILASESAGALVDYSGNGNNATGTFDTPPTINAITGGAHFAGTGAIMLPAALNTAQTVQLFLKFNTGTALSAPDVSPLTGNAANHFINLDFTLHGYGGQLDQPGFGGYHTYIYGNGSDTGHLEAIYQGIVQGTEVVSATFGVSGSRVYSIIGGANQQTAGLQQSPAAGVTGPVSGLQTTGNYQLGGFEGNGAIAPGGSDLYFGDIYYAVFYDRVLTTAELAQNAQAMIASMAARGVPTSPYPDPDGASELDAIGDSITLAAGGLAHNYTLAPQFVLTKTPTYVDDTALDATAACNWAFNGSWPILQTDKLYRGWASNQNTLVIWLGTNDMFFGETPARAEACIAGLARSRKQVGWKVLIVSMMSRTGLDTQKNGLDTLLRADWRDYADGLLDVAADPLLGANGAYTGVYFNGDGIHPTTIGQYEYVTILSRGINRVYGAQDFSSATTYVAAAPAATAITAATEAANVVTITSTLNPPLGSLVSIAGVTPSGYNGSYTVISTSGANFTYSSGTSGLGAGSMFGTASVPLQKDADKYTLLNFGTGNFTLETCVGYTGQNIYIKNINGSSSTIVPWQSETIDGAASLTLTTNTQVTLQSVLVSSAAGGCNWQTVK